MWCQGLGQSLLLQGEVGSCLTRVGSPLLGALSPASPPGLIGGWLEALQRPWGCRAPESGGPSARAASLPMGADRVGGGPCLPQPSWLSPPCSLHKVLFTEQPETYYKWDNWPPESDRK